MLSFIQFNGDVGYPHLPYTKALAYVLMCFGGNGGTRIPILQLRC